MPSKCYSSECSEYAPSWKEQQTTIASKFLMTQGNVHNIMLGNKRENINNMKTAFREWLGLITYYYNLFEQRIYVSFITFSLAPSKIKVYCKHIFIEHLNV